MRQAVVIPLVLLLCLSGCTPDTSEAYKACTRVLTFGVEQDDSLTTDEKLQKVLEAAELCTELAEQDPEQFNEDWGD